MSGPINGQDDQYLDVYSGPATPMQNIKLAVVAVVARSLDNTALLDGVMSALQGTAWLRAVPSPSQLANLRDVAKDLETCSSPEL